MPMPLQSAAQFRTMSETHTDGLLADRELRIAPVRKQIVVERVAREVCGGPSLRIAPGAS
jgi:hypothetical protein